MYGMDGCDSGEEEEVGWDTEAEEGDGGVVGSKVGL